jgi:hypothetical protein
MQTLGHFFEPLYMNDGEATNWKEYYLDTLKDPNTGMPKFSNLVTFLADIRKTFWAADQVWDAVNRLETSKQGKKTAEKLNMEFFQIVGQGEWTERLHQITPSYQVLQKSLGTKAKLQDSLQQQRLKNDWWMDGESHLIQHKLEDGKFIF